MSSNGGIDELMLPLSRQSRRTSNENNKYGIGNNPMNTKETIVPQKSSIDSAADNRCLISPRDNNQQHRTLALSSRLRPSVPNAQVEPPLVHETLTKERTSTGKSTATILLHVYSCILSLRSTLSTTSE